MLFAISHAARVVVGVSGVQENSNGESRRPGVLIVDDDQDLVDLVGYLITKVGLQPLMATAPPGALELFESEHPAVAIIDLNMQPWDGFELLAELRRRDSRMPIMVLTARPDEEGKVRALEMGADDYVVKPFGHRELVARIRAQVRRSQQENSEKPEVAVLVVGPLRLDLRERLLEIDGYVEVRLTGTEFRLLEYLMRNSNSVVTTKALAKHVWGYDDGAARDVVRVTLYRLRRKLGEDVEKPRFIQTVTGVGLKLVAGTTEAKEPSL